MVLGTYFLFGYLGPQGLQGCECHMELVTPDTGE